MIIDDIFYFARFGDPNYVILFLCTRAILRVHVHQAMPNMEQELLLTFG